MGAWLGAGDRQGSSKAQACKGQRVPSGEEAALVLAYKRSMALHSAAWQCTVLHALHSAAWHCTALQGIAQHCTMLLCHAEDPVLHPHWGPAAGKLLCPWLSPLSSLCSLSTASHVIYLRFMLQPVMQNHGEHFFLLVIKAPDAGAHTWYKQP